MARKRTVLQSDFPYHIGARCINREWFQIPLDEVWKIFSEELYMAHHLHDLRIHSFVLMNNHFHLIASTPQANIADVMRRFMTNSSARITKKAGRINQTFGGRHFKCILSGTNYFLSAYKYVYRNPVEAGACQKVEEYPHSTLSGLLGRSQLLIPVAEDSTLFSDPAGTLNWLNTTPPPEKTEAVRWALRRATFSSKKRRSNNRPVIEENDTL